MNAEQKNDVAVATSITLETLNNDDDRETLNDITFLQQQSVMIKRIAYVIAVIIMTALIITNTALNASSSIHEKKEDHVQDIIKLLQDNDVFVEQIHSILQFGPTLAYVDNRTKTLTVVCKPSNNIKQFTFGPEFNFNDCN